jgi:hypothetical protein
MVNDLQEGVRGVMSNSKHRRPLPGVTACIPTVGEAKDVADTVCCLLEGRAYPETILVSDASANDAARTRLERTLESLHVPRTSECSLLQAPLRGTATGNRNWLARHVQTPLLLFLDDDVDIHPDFLHDASSSIDRGADVVVAASTTMGGSGWLTARGHFRPVEPGDPIAVGLACSLWRTSLFRSLWLDERIDYGYEDADLSIRLHDLLSSTVLQSANDFIHRVDHQPPDETKDRDAESARGYVGAKRYAQSRRELARFLIFEMACNAVRRRRLLPRARVPGQWSAVGRYLLGANAPAWADVDAPLVSEPRASGGKG